MVNVLDCGIEVREFDPNSNYYGHFPTDILKKDITILEELFLKFSFNVS